MNKQEKVVTVEEEPFIWVAPLQPEGVPFKPSKRTIEINEMTFTLVKDTKPVTLEFVAFHTECERALNEAAHHIKTCGIKHDRYGLLPRYDRWDYYLDLLNFICVEDVKSLIDQTDLSMDESERAISDFMPESMRLAATLIGFLNSSSS